MRTPTGYALALVAVAIGLSAPFWLGNYWLGILTVAFYFSVFAMSWDLLFGFAGEVNFGPTFLIGLGAYSAGLMNNAGLGIPLCLVGGALTAIVGGVLLALPALRLRGPYFGLVTLVAVLLLLDAIVIFAGITGGEIGMMVPSVLSVSAVTNYWYALGFLVISAIILFFLSRSSLGLILQATGQDRIEAAALGFNVTKFKLAAFCISALFSGLAGAMVTFYQGTASVDQMVDLSIAVQIIIAVVFGGRRTILGGILGALFLILFQQLLLPLGQLNTFIVSGIALLVIILFPDGVLGYALRLMERRT
ncbi:MAG: branched-chain amino acid ABC transporter permease [Acetobacteraceae bacterium]|nr:branched-chain amino acid ABC transporter permease [Acetobacteraceae bacterium]MBV8458205.1 branched-chain amino acid ABC transporter permease [Acetobacteraceae bacterium]